MSEDQQCNLNGKNNHSDPYHLPNTYGGIPQNLMTNLIGLAILLVLFLILRKSALRVLNSIVKKDDVDRWTDLFFSFAQIANPKQLEAKRKKKPQNEQVALESAAEGSPSALIRCHDETTMDDSAHEGEGDAANHDASAGPSASAASADQIETREEKELQARRAMRRQFTLSENPTTLWQWFKTIFTASHAEIEERCGSDALQYLRFQRHIMFYLFIIMVLSIGIILPLNFQGVLQGNATSFEHTTLVNLSADSDLLWVHICMAFLFFPLAILVMRRFSIDVAFQEIGLEVSKTVMIEKIPRSLCTEEAVRNYFSEAFPGAAVKDVRFAYDVRKLLDVDDQLTRAGHAKRYCEHHAEMNRKPFHVYSASCSRCSACFCCCCSQRTEGLEYYTQEVDRLSQEFVQEKETALQTPLGLAFVTFRSLNMAKEVYDSFHRGWFHWQWEPPHTSMSPELKPEHWVVTFAPTPDDIQWGNLAVERRCLLIKMIFVNIALFFVAFFLTTPEMLVSQTESIFLQIGKELSLPSALVDFLPTLLLWSFTALMPLLVSWSDRFLGHYTKSYENHSIMKKTFWYLVFAVIFLPTLGLTAASSFIMGFVGNQNSTIRWECVFLPDSGAFFVNYIITASLMGAGLELIRFPDLVWYAVQICWSKSEADTPAVRQAIKYEFRFGEQYARSLMIFCATIMFSVSCPLITPFGLLYFITKHYVDRHNIMYAYKPSKINKRVHGTAISFVILSTVILQFAMMIFTFVRSKSFDEVDSKTKVAIGTFLLSVNIFSAQLWADTCKKCSPIEYIECTVLRDDENQLRDFIYLPDVLKSEEDKREPCDAADSDVASVTADGDADGAPRYESYA